MTELDRFFHLDADSDEQGMEQNIPLLTSDEEEEMRSSEMPEEVSILALRNTVLFPGVVLPITVGRDTSLELVKESFEKDQVIGVVAQKLSEVEQPKADDIYHVGTVASILKLVSMPDGTKSIVIQGKRRFAVDKVTAVDPFIKAKISALPDSEKDNIELTARIRSIKELAVQIVNESPNLPSEAAFAIQNIDSPTFLIHFIASNLPIKVEDKQELLQTLSIVDRADLVMEHLDRELKVLQLTEEIRGRVRTDVDQQQREFLLRQQLKAIQEELGEVDEVSAELMELREKLDAKNLPEEVSKIAEKEMKKLERTNPASPDHSVIRNYIDWIIDIPWTETSEDMLEISRAEEILNEDHYGLDKVKKRIIEYLAVLKLKGDMKAPILCFHGPPGVGKTSLGKSIARSLGREFVRMSLGGVRDEAEIRGHRRTYVGALPGRIIQSLKKAGTSNPVFMLDEIDKLGSDFRGDPSSALLEVLDPAQNNAFGDHYLDVDFDLSKVMFIATANYIENIPAPLRDRMEMIEINGYTQGEKLSIAKQYLVPRQIEENGLTKSKFKISDAALKEVIDGYTRESGVRQLERTIGGVARGVAKAVAIKEIKSKSVSKDDVETYLGPRRFYSDVKERTEVPGVVTGLAWTPVGGDILFIEASISRGNGRLVLTGKLGDVMKESAQAARSYVKANAEAYGIPQSAFDHWDVHVHVPAGAVPKDGPSAGVSMITALTSIYTQRKVRQNLAMTGEITLRGLVLPVGGIKEKVLAAKRAGIKELILPAKNKKDVDEIPKEVLGKLRFNFVSKMTEVLDLALEKKALENPVKKFAVPDKKSSKENS